MSLQTLELKQKGERGENAHLHIFDPELVRTARPFTPALFNARGTKGVGDVRAIFASQFLMSAHVLNTLKKGQASMIPGNYFRGNNEGGCIGN